MSTVTSLLSISLGMILVENIIFSQFLGICPFMGVSKKMDTALGMGLAVIFVMTAASAVTWVVNEYLLAGLQYMQTVAFILVIAALVQLIEMFLQKMVPALYSALGIYLPLITTNCAVLGVALNNVGSGFVEAVVRGLTGGVGFTVAIVLFASVRERLELAECPNASVTLLGGDVHAGKNYIETLDPDISHVLRSFYFDKVFITVDGIDLERGYTVNNKNQIGLYTQLARMTRRFYILADSAKYDRRAFASVFPPEKTCRMISTSGAPQSIWIFMPGREFHARYCRLNERNMSD